MFRPTATKTTSGSSSLPVAGAARRTRPTCPGARTGRPLRPRPIGPRQPRPQPIRARPVRSRPIRAGPRREAPRTRGRPMRRRARPGPVGPRTDCSAAGHRVPARSRTSRTGARPFRARPRPLPASRPTPGRRMCRPPDGPGQPTIRIATTLIISALIATTLVGMTRTALSPGSPIPAPLPSVRVGGGLMPRWPIPARLPSVRVGGGLMPRWPIHGPLILGLVTRSRPRRRQRSLAQVAGCSAAGPAGRVPTRSSRPRAQPARAASSRPQPSSLLVLGRTTARRLTAAGRPADGWEALLPTSTRPKCGGPSRTSARGLGRVGSAPWRRRTASESRMMASGGPLQLFPAPLRLIPGQGRRTRRRRMRMQTPVGGRSGLRRMLTRAPVGGRSALRRMRMQTPVGGRSGLRRMLTRAPAGGRSALRRLRVRMQTPVGGPAGVPRVRRTRAAAGVAAAGEERTQAPS